MKFGRKPAVHTQRRMKAMLSLQGHLQALGTPPVSTNWRAAVRQQNGMDWGMFGNDQYGCCVWADSAHRIMLNSANAGQIIIPTVEDVLIGYSVVTGFQAGPPVVHDEGTDENAAIAYLTNIGIGGQRIDDSAPLDTTDMDSLKWAVAMFGGVRLGILVSTAYMQAFESRQPWDIMQLGMGNEGHDVLIADYDASGVYVVTWGRDDQFIPWATMTNTQFCEEAHAELWYDWIRAQGTAPDGMDLAQLDADLKYIGEEDKAVLPSIFSDSATLEAAKHGVARSHHWPTVEHEFKSQNPDCAAGGRGPIQVHHCLVSFHVAILLGRPDLELDHRNLISLTEGPDKENDGLYHLYLGHGDNFRKDCNPTVRDDVVMFHGKPCSEIKSDPIWLAHAAACPPPWSEWTDEMKTEKKAWLDETLPPDTSLLQRFGITLST